MPQNNSRIQGEFYPLQHKEWLRANTVQLRHLSVKAGSFLIRGSRTAEGEKKAGGVEVQFGEGVDRHRSFKHFEEMR